MSYLILILVCFLYFLMFLFFWNGALSKKILFGIIIFFGVDSLYFFIASLLDFKLNIFFLLLTNLLFGVLAIFIRYKRTKFKRRVCSDRLINITIVFVVITTISIFINNFKSINNGLRIPIPSFTEDASQHFHIILDIFSQNRFSSSSYPFAFHGNAWLFIKLATQITGKTDDFVFITNIFSLYIWLILFITLSLFSMIVFDLVAQIKSSHKLRSLLVALTSLFLGSVVSLYFVEYGFFSNWFNQLFSLAIIYLVSKNDKKMFIFLIPLTFGFFYSYSFFMPVLVVFYGYLFLIKRNKGFLFLFLLSLLLSAVFFIKLLLSHGSVSYLVVAAGGFPTYSLVTILAYLLLSFFFLKKASEIEKKINNNGILNYLTIFAILFLLYAILFAVFQLVLNGAISYSFHKIFATVFMFLAILASGGFVLFIEELIFNKSKISLSWKFEGLTILVLVLVSLSGYINPPLQTIFLGTGNFFTNNKEKYNTVIFALENFSNYKNVIYIDGDYQSTRWATLSYLPTKFNVLYNKEDVTNYKNYDYYVSELKKTGSSTLILNPSRFLEVDCDSESLIKIATSSTDIKIYPFDSDLFNKNCMGQNNKKGN